MYRSPWMPGIHTLHIGSITHRPLDTTTLPTSVRLADAMTITGIDSTGQSAGGNVLRPRHVTDAEDLDAELRTLEDGVTTTAPISVVPAVEAAPEQRARSRRGGAGRGAGSLGGTLLR